MESFHSLIENQSFSHLGKHSLLKGEFKLNGHTVINSYVEGNIEVLEQSSLIIGVESRVFGNIKCHDIEIYGEFEGEIESTGNVICFSPATITGSIKANNLIINPGAKVNIEGETSMAELN